eukprot:gene9190-10890_t
MFEAYQEKPEKFTERPVAQQPINSLEGFMQNYAAIAAFSMEVILLETTVMMVEMMGKEEVGVGRVVAMEKTVVAGVMGERVVVMEMATREVVAVAMVAEVMEVEAEAMETAEVRGMGELEMGMEAMAVEVEAGVAQWWGVTAVKITGQTVVPKSPMVAVVGAVEEVAKQQMAKGIRAHMELPVGIHGTQVQWSTRLLDAKVMKKELPGPLRVVQLFRKEAKGTL